MSHSPCVNTYRTRYAFHNRQALTLLELVVVLGILALLSTVAVRSLEPIADQARYEATQRILNDVRFATVGDNSHRFTSGQPVISGYAADTGALPSSVDDLLASPVGMSAHAVQLFDSDRDTVNDVTLSSGWNGPYLQLGAGYSDVVDGWGREPTILAAGGSIDILSQGSDGDSLLSEDGYRADITVSVTDQDYAGDIVFRLFAIDSLSGTRVDPTPPVAEQLGVLFYGVNAAGGTSGTVQEQMLVVAASGSFDYRRSNTIHGTVAARAIQWIDTDLDDVLDATESITKKSYVHYATVNSAADVRVEMEIR